ncbi:hypothetical protein [Rhodobacter lacus]|uniref:Death domain-containing protein n=1 Tax=Rhodobacter lacus TaxID=1641972 RepID=A0ABW5ACU1_9RHOB
MSFGEMKDFERRTETNFLGSMNGEIWYLPNDTPRAAILEAAATLKVPRRDPRPILGALKRLWLSTKHEKMSEADRDELFRAYADRLSSYPEEACASVLISIERTSKFFPAWSDIESALSERLGWRGTALQNLRGYIQRNQPQ